MPKIKGSHTAMKSGMIAAEAIIEHLQNNKMIFTFDRLITSLINSPLWEVRD